MIRIILSAAISQVSVPEEVPLHLAANAAARYGDQMIRTCGILMASTVQRELLLADEPSVNQHYLSVDTSKVSLVRPGQRVCVEGVMRRRDGLSQKEANARNIMDWTRTHGAQSPNYVLRVTVAQKWKKEAPRRR